MKGAFAHQFATVSVCACSAYKGQLLFLIMSFIKSSSGKILMIYLHIFASV